MAIKHLPQPESLLDGYEDVRPRSQLSVKVASLARALVDAADTAAAQPDLVSADRVLGLAQAYVCMMDNASLLLREDYEVAEVVDLARGDLAYWDACYTEGATVTTYLWLTEDQEACEARAMTLTRRRGDALARWRVAAGLSLQQAADEIRRYGYDITRHGVKWLEDNAAPAGSLIEAPLSPEPRDEGDHVR